MNITLRQACESVRKERPRELICECRQDDTSYQICVVRGAFDGTNHDEVAFSGVNVDKRTGRVSRIGSGGEYLDYLEKHPNMTNVNS